MDTSPSGPCGQQRHFADRSHASCTARQCSRVAVENARERAQVMLQNVPRIEIPGIPNARRELYSLEGAEEFGLDPARCLRQSHYVAGTRVIVGEGV